ncbi:hypothetical protein PHMEG_00027646, partial [Phytophthora megakarya]
MTADDPNSFGDSDSDSDEPSVSAPTTETRSNSTSIAPPVIDMTADDPNSFGDSDSDSDEPSVSAPTTETRSNSTATTIRAVDPHVAGSLVSTPLSEERLWKLLNSSSQYTLENFCQAMDGQLAEMLRFYATLPWGPNPQAALKSAEASRTVMENKLFSEQCVRANAETWVQQFSADRDAAHKEIKLVKSREASLNVQIKMYDRLENRFQLALRSNEILTKEVNHGRSEYLIQAFKKSHEKLHKILCQTDPKETTLTPKLRERNRDLVRRVKRLEKANSALSSRLRLGDMDPESLVLMVEGFELDKIDWETLAPDSQTCRALKVVYKIGLEDGRDHDRLADDIAFGKVRFAEMRAEKQRKAEEAAAAAAPPSAAPAGSSQSSTVPPTHSLPASTSPAPPVSGGKKGKGKARRRCTRSDDEDGDFGGGDSGEDVPEEGRECSATPSSATTSQPQPKKQKSSSPASPPTPTEKSQPSSKSSTKSSSSKPSSIKSPSSKSSAPVADASTQDQSEGLPLAPPPTVSDAEVVTQSLVPSVPSRPAEPSGGTPSTSPIVIQRKPRTKGNPTKKTRSESGSQTSVSSRRVITASPKLQLTFKFPKKILKNFRGDGHKQDTEFGFSQWERDHWIPPRAVELFITMAFTTLCLNMPSRDRLEVLEIKTMFDAVDDVGRGYNLDGVKRNDRFRTKYPYISWKWSLKFPPPVDGMIPGFPFEPTMPLYGMEYLTWIPKTPLWLKEVADLDARGHGATIEIVGGWEQTFQ